MDSFDLLVINGIVVTASDTANYDIAIKNGKIALLAPVGILDQSSAKRVIDAEGGYVTVSI
jgi:dihydropyrimidinase